MTEDPTTLLVEAAATLRHLEAALAAAENRLPAGTPREPLAGIDALIDRIHHHLAEHPTDRPSERQVSAPSTTPRLVALTTWAGTRGTPVSTARRWAASGRLPGTQRDEQGHWLVPANLAGPDSRWPGSASTSTSTANGEPR